MKIRVPAFSESVIRLIVDGEKIDYVNDNSREAEVGDDVQLVEAVGIDNGGKQVGDPVCVFEAEVKTSAPDLAELARKTAATLLDANTTPEAADAAAKELSDAVEATHTEAEKATAVNLESSLNLGQDKPEVESPFKSDVVKKHLAPAPDGPVKKGL